MIAYYITKLNVNSFILNLKDAEKCNNTLVTSVTNQPDTRGSLRDTLGDGYVSYTVADPVHTSKNVSCLTVLQGSSTLK